MPEVRSLDLAGRFATMRVLSDMETFAIEKRTIVVNPTLSEVAVDAPGANIIPALSSRTLQSVSLEHADMLVLVQPPDAAELRPITSESGWRYYSDITSGSHPGDRARTPLWRSSQVEIGALSIALTDIPGQHDIGQTQRSFRVRLNLWFAEAGTDCGIHNEHEFMEIHTQIAGTGRMQKFLRSDEASLYEDELMVPGYTTSVPYCEVAGVEAFNYPWHRYYAETDCIWLALEYWPEPISYSEGNVPLLQN